MGNTPTSKFGYNKPAVGDRGWGVTQNGNWDALDTDLGVEHEATGAHGPKVTIDQTGNDLALDITHSTTGSSAAVYIDRSTGSGYALGISNAGTGDGIYVQQDGAGIGVHINHASTGGGAALHIAHSGSAYPIDTDAGAGTPAHLTTGGVWTDASCYRIYKQDFEDVDPNDFLVKVETMPIQRYRIKLEVERGIDRTYLGPFQDELVNDFGLCDEGVRPTEVAAIALVAIKALKAQNDALEARVAALEAQVGA